MQHPRLWLLFAAHIILGIAFCAWIAIEKRVPFVLEEILFVPHLAFMFSQASLLAIWAVLSRCKPWQRLTGWVLGVTYLTILLPLGTGINNNHFLVTGISSISAIILLALRWRFDLQPIDTRNVAARQPTLQFSIRGLLLLTLVAAIVTFTMKAALIALNDVVLLLFMAIMSAFCAAAGIAAALAALSRSYTLAKSLASLVFAAALGAMLVVIDGSRNWESYFYFCATLALQSALVIGSLSVVRSCGYRLVSGCGSISQTAIQQNGHHSSLH